MSPAIADAQVREYLDAVRAWLGDLDAEEREHLLLFNSFPIRYFEQGTRRVRRPEAGALSERPRPIVTPRVRIRQR